MKVLLIPGSPPEDEGVASGIDQYIRMLTRGMSGRVEYIYLDDPFFVRSQHNKYEPVFGQVSKRPWFKKLIPYGLRLLFGYTRDTMRLAVVMRPYRNKVDLVHVNRIGCEIQPIAARLAGFKRIVATIHNLPGEDEPAGYWARRIIEKISFTCADALIAVSTATFEKWHKRVGLPKRKTLIIYNGMKMPDFAGFDRNIYRKNLCGDPEAVIFGIVAQLEHRKGIIVAIEAFSRLLKTEKRAYLIITGTGPEETRLKARVDGFGIADKVIFLGYRQDGFEIIASLDVNVSVSISLETLCYTVVEAMFASVPSIVSDVGGSKELIYASGGGKVTPKNDVAAVYEAMKFYIENSQARTVDGMAAKRYAEKNLTVRQMAEKTYEVYKSLYSKSKSEIKWE